MDAITRQLQMKLALTKDPDVQAEFYREYQDNMRAACELLANGEVV
jgi:hypothetical protein